MQFLAYRALIKKFKFSALHWPLCKEKFNGVIDCDGYNSEKDLTLGNDWVLVYCGQYYIIVLFSIVRLSDPDPCLYFFFCFLNKIFIVHIIKLIIKL